MLAIVQTGSYCMQFGVFRTQQTVCCRLVWEQILGCHTHLQRVCQAILLLHLCEVYQKKLYYGSITCYTKNLCPILFCPWESRALFLSSFLCSFVVLLRVPPVALIVDHKVVPIGVAYDIQNQVLGSTSQLIQPLDLVGVPNVVHREVYSTKVYMARLSVFTDCGIPFTVEPTDSWDTVSPNKIVFAGHYRKLRSARNIVGGTLKPSASTLLVISFNISAGIYCHYFSPLKCYMPPLLSTQSVSFSFYSHAGTMVEHKLLIKLSGLFRRGHQKPFTQILRNGV